MRGPRILAALLAILLGSTLLAQAAPEFRARRDACRKQLDQGQALLLRSSSKDGARLDDDFYYLTGVEDAGCALLVATDGDVLFAPPGPDGETRRPPGFAKVRPADQLDKALADSSGKRKIVDGRGAKTVVARLRRIKSPAELDKLRTAAEITNLAQMEVMRTAKPGMIENELQAALEGVFHAHGAERCGFPSIVGSGPNSCILHWSENTRKTEAGDVVVVDIGAEYEHYTADVTRTIPISGKFTDRQKQVYEVVLAANEAAIAMIAPGVDMRDVDRKVEQVMSDGLVKLGILKPDDRRGLRRYYIHGLSHPIGLTVHDVGGLGKLEPGMVITIEPGLYFPAEKMGFRIEDDVLVTKKGHEVLSAGAPKQVAAIEKLMAEAAREPAK